MTDLSNALRQLRGNMNNPIENFNSIKRDIEVELTGKSNADFSKQTYSETVIDNNVNTARKFNVDYGMLLSMNELQENVPFDKLVLLKNYGTQVNKFNDSETDVIYTFVDRDGVEIRSNKWSQLNTSNAITSTERLNYLKGKVVLLHGRLIKKGNRRFIEVIQIKETPVDQDTYKLFFRREISNIKSEIDNLNNKIGGYRISYSLFKKYEDILCSSEIKNSYEKKGAYVSYLNHFIGTLDTLNTDLKTKDSFIFYDMLKQLLDFVDVTKLLGEIKSICGGIYEPNFIDNMLREVLNMEDTPSIYEIVSNNYRKSIVTLMLFEDWNKMQTPYVYSNYHKSLITLRRDVD